MGYCNPKKVLNFISFLLGKNENSNENNTEKLLKGQVRVTAFYGIALFSGPNPCFNPKITKMTVKHSENFNIFLKIRLKIGMF